MHDRATFTFSTQRGAAVGPLKPCRCVTGFRCGCDGCCCDCTDACIARAHLPCFVPSGWIDVIADCWEGWCQRSCGEAIYIRSSYCDSTRYR